MGFLVDLSKLHSNEKFYVTIAFFIFLAEQNMKNIAFCFGVAIMVILLNACSVGQDSVDSHIDSHTKKYLPQNRDELLALVRDNSVNLGDIDTSKITDMRLLFDGSERVGFSGIENWNTSNVVDMSNMFSSARFFNHNIKCVECIKSQKYASNVFWCDFV